MKKLFFIFLALAALCGHAHAQTESNVTDFREKLMFGLKAGVNYSNVYDTEGNVFQSDPKLGLAAGAFIAIPIGEFFGVQPEILFSQKGFKAKGSVLGEAYSLTRTTNYIDVPLLFCVKPSEFITILAGPQYSYLMKQKNSFETGSTSIAQEIIFETDNFRKNTLCFTGGADLTLKQIVISLRAGWDVRNNNGDGSYSTLHYKNMWYQATAGFRL